MNWLEEEESKKSIHAQEQALVHQKEIIIRNDILKFFFDLCNRAINIKPYSISHEWLRVVGRTQSKIKSVGYGGYGGVLYSHIQRGIKFNATTSDKIIINVFIHEYKDSYDREFHLESKKETTIISKKCLPQDILNWQEERILNTIQWLIFEKDFIKENIPDGEILKEEKF